MPVQNPHIPLFREAVRALLGSQPRNAEHHLIRLKGKTVKGAPDTGKVPLRLRVATFRRDQFTCRYCYRQTVFMPVLVTLSLKFPMTFPFSGPNPNVHSHASFWSDIPVCDHVLSPANGGKTELDNLVTTCGACYTAKSQFPDPMRWRPKTIAVEKWDGLHQKLYDLCVVTNSAQEPYFFEWLKVLKEGI